MKLDNSFFIYIMIIINIELRALLKQNSRYSNFTDGPAIYKQELYVSTCMNCTFSLIAHGFDFDNMN